MILKNVDKTENFMIYEYEATWPYNFDFMLDVSKILLISDFQNSLLRFAYANNGRNLIELTTDLKNLNYNFKKCFSSPCDIIAIAGNSHIMQIPLQIMLFNNNETVKLYIPISYANDDNHRFDKYMDSLEIKAYCVGYHNKKEG